MCIMHQVGCGLGAQLSTHVKTPGCCCVQWQSIHALAPDEEAMQSQFRRLWSLKEVGLPRGLNTLAGPPLPASSESVCSKAL